MSVVTPEPVWPPEEPIEPDPPPVRDPNEEPPWTGPPELKGEVQEVARDYA